MKLLRLLFIAIVAILIITSCKKNRSGHLNPCTQPTSTVYSIATPDPGIYAVSMSSAITYDASGSAFVAGFYSSGLNVGGGMPVLTGNGLFLEKLTASGAPVWIKPIVTGIEPKRVEVSTDAAQNIYLVWYAINHTLGQYDLNVAKLDAMGNVIWKELLVNNVGVLYKPNTTVRSDNEGCTYVMCHYREGTDFDPDPLNSAGFASNLDGTALQKLSPTGAYVWVMSVTDNYNNASFTISNTNNVIITGQVSGIGTVGGGGVHVIGASGVVSDYALTLDPAGRYVTSGSTPRIEVIGLKILGNTYLIHDSLKKVDVSGKLLWRVKLPLSETLGANNSAMYQAAATDASGNIYLSGKFNGTFNFDPKGNHTLSTTGTSGYLEKIDASGNFVWVLQTQQGFMNLTVDDKDNIYGTGYYTNTNRGSTDIFVSKISQCK